MDLMARFGKIGIGPGRSWDASKIDPQTLTAIDEGVGDSSQLPPVKFFWSLALYTFPDRLLCANSIDRYSIGDRTKGLIFGKDKSLTIYLGHTSPGKAKKANWLPTPEGKYSLVARIYGPEKAAIDGSWELPEPVPMK
jgi:hypothetical protein